MEFKKLMSAAVLLGAVSMGAATASAQRAYWNEFEAQFSSGGKTGCYVCHDTSGKSGWTTLGSTFSAVPHTGGNLAGAVTTVGAQTNPATNNTFGVDWAAGTLPAATTPTSSSGGGGCVTSSITTPLTMALAMLTLGFFVRRKKD